MAKASQDKTQRTALQHSPELQSGLKTFQDTMMRFYRHEVNEAELFASVEALLALPKTAIERSGLGEAIHTAMSDAGLHAWNTANERTNALGQLPDHFSFGKKLLSEALTRKWVREGTQNHVSSEGASNTAITELAHQLGVQALATTANVK